MRVLRLLADLPSCASDGFRDFLELTPPGREAGRAFLVVLRCLTIASEGREAWAAYCPCAAFSLVWFCWRDLVSGWTGGEAERETIDGHVYLEEFIALGFEGRLTCWTAVRRAGGEEGVFLKASGCVWNSSRGGGAFEKRTSSSSLTRT